MVFVANVLTNKFCQDPTEELFVRQRATGRRADNMNLARLCEGCGIGSLYRRSRQWKSSELVSLKTLCQDTISHGP